VFESSFADIFDSKIVKNETESCAACAMAPETGGAIDRVVIVGGEVCFELLVGNNAGLLQSIHASPDFDVDPAVWSGDVFEFVLIDDFLGDDVEVEAHVLVARHGSAKVEVF
jgi:hypothetical protein